MNNPTPPIHAASASSPVNLRVTERHTVQVPATEGNRSSDSISDTLETSGNDSAGKPLRPPTREATGPENPAAGNDGSGSLLDITG